MFPVSHSLEGIRWQDINAVQSLYYGYDSLNCFTLILCGESHFNDILRKPIHEALRQRITIHYNYEGLVGARQEHQVIDDEIIFAAVNSQNF